MFESTIEFVIQMGSMNDVISNPVFWFGVATGIAFDEMAKKVYNQYLKSGGKGSTDSQTDK